VPTNRGNKEFFGHIPFHHGFKYSTSMPSTTQGRWVLEYADYYQQEAGIPLFQYWNRIVKMQMELLTIENPKAFAQLWNEIQRIRKNITPFVSKNGVLFTLANAFDNLQSIGLSYLKENKKKVPSLIFMVEMMNFLFDKVEDCFYAINEEKQLYYPSLDESKLLETAVSSNYNFEILSKKTSVYDKDCNPSLPLEIVPDWGSSICLFSVSQERNFDFKRNIQSNNRIYQTFINEFYVKPDDNKNVLIKELCDMFTAYYSLHSNKTIHYYRDRYGDSRNPNVINSKSYNEQAIEYLTKAGWKIVSRVHRGNEPPQSDKYLLWGNILNEDTETLPCVRFNALRCKYTLISMNNAMVKTEGTKVEKDKRSERKSSGILPEEATHFSDAVDKIIWTKFSNVLSKTKSMTPVHLSSR
jgi:hypothetical protein